MLIKKNGAATERLGGAPFEVAVRRSRSRCACGSKGIAHRIAAQLVGATSPQ